MWENHMWVFTARETLMTVRSRTKTGWLSVALMAVKQRFLSSAHRSPVRVEASALFDVKLKLEDGSLLSLFWKEHRGVWTTAITTEPSHHTFIRQLLRGLVIRLAIVQP